MRLCTNQKIIELSSLSGFPTGAEVWGIDQQLGLVPSHVCLSSLISICLPVVLQHVACVLGDPGTSMYQHICSMTDDHALTGISAQS